MAKVIEMIPVGSITFFDNDLNPAEEWPGTTWEQVINDLYICGNDGDRLGPDGMPVGPHTVLRCWMRMS